MRRASTALVSIGAVFLFGAWMVGGNSDAIAGVVMLVVAVVSLGTGLVLRRRGSVRARRADDRWRAARSEPVASSGPGPGDRGLRTVAALGRVEARELVGSPWFAVGGAFAVLLFVLFGFLWADDYSSHWWEVAGVLPLFAHPLVGMAVIASHRAVTRARRDRCDELFASCPLDEGGRLTGHLLPALLVGSLTAAFAALVFATVTSREAVYGSLDLRVPLIVATCGVLAAGGVALGVALGRWAPFSLAPVVALVAVAFVDDRLLGIGGLRWSTDRYLATFDDGAGPDQVLLDLPVGPRLVWFAALAVVVAAVALLGLRRWAVPTLAGGVAAAAIAAFGVVAPMSDPARLAARVVDPARTERCVAVGAAHDLSVCAPADYAGAAQQYAGALATTAAALPDRRAVPVRFRMRLLDEPLDALPAELAAALPADLVDGAGRVSLIGSDREVVVAYAASTHPRALRAARYRLVAEALGLPTEAGAEERPTVVAGRASGVAVLWLGTLGMDRDDRRRSFAISPDDHADEVIDATVRGQVWPDPCYDHAAPLTWAPEDLEAATRLVALADEHVLRVLHERWDDLDTLSTDDLLVAAGADPVGPTSPIEDRPHVCGW